MNVSKAGKIAWVIRKGNVPCKYGSFDYWDRKNETWRAMGYASTYTDFQKNRAKFPPDGVWVKIQIDPGIAEEYRPYLIKLDGNQGCYWSGERWLPCRGKAKRYTQDDRRSLTLPPQGKWVRLVLRSEQEAGERILVLELTRFFTGALEKMLNLGGE
jgi:hypothetical protein